MGRAGRRGRFLVLAEAAAVEPGLEIAAGGGIPGGTQGRGTIMQMRNMAAMLPARQGEPGGEEGSMKPGDLLAFVRVGCERERSLGRLRVGVHDRVLLVRRGDSS